MRKTLLAATFASALMGFGPVAQADTAGVSVAPPPPRHEIFPPPRQGWVWAPGHYAWHGNTYVWQRGQWLRERPGYEYREQRWVQRPDGSWVMVGGDWEHRPDERAQARRDRG